MVTINAQIVRLILIHVALANILMTSDIEVAVYYRWARSEASLFESRCCLVGLAIHNAWPAFWL